MNKKSLYLEKDGLKMHYRVLGQGKPLVLLNAAFSDMRVWSYVEERLSEGYMVIQLDFRYTGETEQDASDYSMYEDLNTLIEALDLETVSLVGLSAGGHTALEYALKYPEKVDKIFLISTGLFGVAEDENKIVRMKDFQTALYSGKVDEAADIWTKMWLLGEQRNHDDLSSDKVDLFRSVTKQSLMSSANFKMPYFLDPPVNVQLDKLESKVYHLIGSLDYDDVSNSSQVFKEKVKDYVEERLASAHIIPFDLPKLLVDRIVDFIG